MKKLNLPIIFQLLLAIGASSSGATIFLDSQGKDPRQPMLGPEMPWSAIGLVTARDGDWDNDCTGALIGKRLVLTAAHCMIDDNEDPKKNTLLRHGTFKPNYKNGHSVDSSAIVDVIIGTMDYNENSSNDWAILILKDDLGTKYGTMDVVSSGELTLPMDVQTAGYGGDFEKGLTAGVVSSCQIKDKFVGFNEDGNSPVIVYNDNCTSAAGDSGSPIFHMENGRYTIAAVLTSGGTDLAGNEIRTQDYSFEVANEAVMNDALVQAVQAAKLKYDQ